MADQSGNAFHSRCDSVTGGVWLCVVGPSGTIGGADSGAQAMTFALFEHYRVLFCRSVYPHLFADSHSFLSCNDDVKFPLLMFLLPLDVQYSTTSFLFQV